MKKADFEALAAEVRNARTVLTDSERKRFAMLIARAARQRSKFFDDARFYAACELD